MIIQQLTMSNGLSTNAPFIYCMALISLNIAYIALYSPPLLSYPPISKGFLCLQTSFILLYFGGYTDNHVLNASQWECV